MWIDAEDGRGATDASSGTTAVHGSAVTVTGRSCVRGVPGAAHPMPFPVLTSPLKNLVGVDTVFGATRAIDASGTSVASTIRRFSSAVRRARFAGPLVVARWLNLRLGPHIRQDPLKDKS